MSLRDGAIGVSEVGPAVIDLTANVWTEGLTPATAMLLFMSTNNGNIEKHYHNALSWVF